MIDAPLALAFTGGLLAAVNPCGFPMLPAYVSWFIGLDDDRAEQGSRVPRAVGAGASVSLGFLAVFVGLGIPINAGMGSIYRWMPWLTIVIGIALAALGVAMVLGHSIKVALPRLDRGGRTRRFGSMFVFGVSYAVASLGCTLPVFLFMVVGTAHRANALSGLLAFVAFGLGMSLVLMTLSLALALAREGMVRWLRASLRYVDRVAGGLLVVVGAYLVYYGQFATDPTRGTGTTPVSWVESWSTRAGSWLNDGGARLGWILATMVATGVALSLVARSRARGAP
ncbi:MAG: cytochrome c biogenesis protein CcdA [Acidobacteria bacterium]|nr:cytochrome c biogenesis protein CcdA [Acidobacteriota bacterium]